MPSSVRPEAVARYSTSLGSRTMTTHHMAAATGDRPGIGQRLGDRLAARLQRLPPATHEYTIVRDVRIPTRDGVDLLADLYEPLGAARGNVMVRSPYGWPMPV